MRSGITAVEWRKITNRRRRSTGSRILGFRWLSLSSLVLGSRVFFLERERERKTKEPEEWRREIVHWAVEELGFYSLCVASSIGPFVVILLRGALRSFSTAGLL